MGVGRRCWCSSRTATAPAAAPLHGPTSFGFFSPIGPVEVEGRPIVQTGRVDPKARSSTLQFERGGRKACEL